MKKPKISIITVCLNSEKTIEKTILSVINQTYKNIEYIIVDGGSTDKTLEIIKKYKDKISLWVSEKDNGIYDAMNKGTNLAHGKYLNFMNSDDYFINENVIENVLPFLDGKNDIVYGNTKYRYKNLELKIKCLNPNLVWMGTICHQSSFIKREIIQKYKYNTENKLIADYEFFLNVYYNNGKILKINKFIASYSILGISGKNNNQVILDLDKTIKKFDNRLIVRMYCDILGIKPQFNKILHSNKKFGGPTPDKIKPL